MEVKTMRRMDLRRVAGLTAAAFGAGILLSFLLHGYLLALIEAVVVVTAGILLFGKGR